MATNSLPDVHGLSKAQRKALEFIRKVNGWHGYASDAITRRIVRSLAARNLVEVSENTQQFRAVQFRPVRFEETEVRTWFERDRAHVELRDSLTDQTIVEFWDGAVSEAIEDGFLNPRDYHQSAFDYAQSLGLLPVVPVTDSEETEAE